MATFTGTNADEIITTGFVSPTVVANPIGSLPSNADDSILAGAGVDTINSGGGNDTVTGGQGNDNAVLGEGDDTFIWRPGDGSDIVEGGTGFDTLDFFGSNASENIDHLGERPASDFFRDMANITMDLNDVERYRLSRLRRCGHDKRRTSPAPISPASISTSRAYLAPVSAMARPTRPASSTARCGDDTITIGDNGTW